MGRSLTKMLENPKTDGGRSQTYAPINPTERMPKKTKTDGDIVLEPAHGPLHIVLDALGQVDRALELEVLGGLLHVRRSNLGFFLHCRLCIVRCGIDLLRLCLKIVLRLLWLQFLWRFL